MKLAACTLSAALPAGEALDLVEVDEALHDQLRQVVEPVTPTAQPGTP